MPSGAPAREPISPSLLAGLRTMPRLRFYFRYPLRPADFREVARGGRLLGQYAAKPLYDRLTEAGRVDTSAGFSGRIAILFLPAAARSPEEARLLFTALAPGEIALPNGRRNWPAIRDAAEAAIREAASPAGRL